MDVAMLVFDPNLLKSFTVFDVFDPNELGDDSRVSCRFPGYNNHNTYRLLDRGLCNERPQGLLTRLAVRREGVLTLSYVSSRFGTDVGIVGNGAKRLFLTFSLSGGIALQSGTGAAAMSSGTSGLVYRGLAGTQLVTTEGNSRFTLQIDESRLLRLLESLLDDACPECPSFAPQVDWADPSTAPIVRMVRHLIEELGDHSGLFSVAPALETFTDLLAQLVLARLPHSHSSQLQAPRSPALPRQIRRAEAFIEAHVDQPISVADIAAAAGCGAGALRLAFRRFRDTTPLAAVQDARLRAVRAALRTSDIPASLLARDYGFSNAHRFRLAFRKRFGVDPRESR